MSHHGHATHPLIASKTPGYSCVVVGKVQLALTVSNDTFISSVYLLLGRGYSCAFNVGSAKRATEV